MKTVFITGAGGGIGYATAVYLAQQGFKVIAGVRNPADVAKLQQLTLENLYPVELDVTNPTQVANAISLVNQQCATTGLAALINNAGINYMAPFEFYDEQKVRQLMEVNVFSLMSITRSLLPLLQKYYQQTGHTSKVINLGSIGSIIGLPWEFSYHVAKFAVWGFSQSLRFELEALGIDVTCVMPGGIKTQIFDKTNQSANNAAQTLTGANVAYYHKNLENMKTNATNFYKNATEPLVVAKKLTKLINKRRSPEKLLIGLDAKIIYELCWLGLRNVLKSQFVKH